jgi:hypothetical protein
MKIAHTKSIFFFAVYLVSMIIIFELSSAIVYRSIFHEYFSYADLQNIRANVVKPALERPDPGGPRGFWLSHPYYGFVTNPYYGFVHDPKAGSDVNEYGFFGEENQIQPGDPTTLVVAVAGGSVAAQFALPSYAGRALENELKKIPIFQDKKIKILDLGNGAFKQPQALMIINDLLSRGGHIDMLIELDGFNEIALPEAHGNVRDNISPFFPQGWRQLVESKVSRDQSRALGISQITADIRLYFASIFSMPIIRNSITANLIWRVVNDRLFGIELRYRRLADQAPPLNPDSRIGAGGQAFLGPFTTYSTRRDLYMDIAKQWARSSILLNNIMAAHAGLYIHFLQPNQYISGSKNFTDHETQIAINLDSPYKSPVEIGYPYLRAMGESLRAGGIWFEDLTMVFSGHEQELYKDSCCHINKEGNEILARAVAQAVVARLSGSHGEKTRAIQINAVDFGESVFEKRQLRQFVENPDGYNDGSEEPVQQAKTDSEGKISVRSQPEQLGSALPAVAPIRPQAWKRFDGASFSANGDEITMTGPGYLSTDSRCAADACDVRFQLTISYSDGTTMGLRYLDEAGKFISEKTWSLFSKTGTITIDALTPEKTKTVCAIINSPNQEQRVTFKNPVFYVRPIK